jgi:hypothetical protein
MARIRQKLDRAEWAKLSQDMQALYTERDGTYFLDSDDAEEMRSTLARQKGELTEAKRKLDAMRDVDPDEYQRLKTAAEKAERDKELEKGNFEKLEAQRIEEHARELKKRDDAALALRRQLEDSLVDGELTRAISTKYPTAKLTPIILGAKQTIKSMEIGGKLRAVVVDEKGEPRLKAGAKTTDDYMGPADRVDEMRNDKEWAPLFPATNVAQQNAPRAARSLSANDRGMNAVADNIAQQIRDGKDTVS